MSFELSTLGVVQLILLGAFMFGLLRLFRHGLGLVKMPPSRRAQFDRVMPVLETLVAFSYIVWAVPKVFKDDPTYSAIGLGLILLGTMWVSWFAIRDFITGAFLRSGKVVSVGDLVELNELSGRVTRLGYRILAIETADGDEALIPYSQLASRSVVRQPVVYGLARHSFHVEPRSSLSTMGAREAVLRCALNHHWSSLACLPLIERHNTGVLHVTVFALCAQRGPDIEAAVRSAVEA